MQIESTHTIDIDSFVPADEIDKRYLNHPYYIVPDGKAGIDAFAVIRDAMKDKDRVALARIVLTNREHVIAIEPLGKGLLATTLRYPYELRDADEYFDGIKTPEDLEGHGRTRRPHPRQQGGAFRSVEIQGRLRDRAEGAGEAQGRRQVDQGAGAGGEVRQRRQPDGRAEGRACKGGRTRRQAARPPHRPADAAECPPRTAGAASQGSPAEGDGSARRGKSIAALRRHAVMA